MSVQQNTRKSVFSDTNANPCQAFPHSYLSFDSVGTSPTALPSGSTGMEAGILARITGLPSYQNVYFYV
jgi:hypothetical protein